MNSDFAAYLDNLKKQIKSFDANLTITEKKLQYGIQLTVTNSDSKVVLSVYNGKKGIKLFGAVRLQNGGPSWKQFDRKRYCR